LSNYIHYNTILLCMILYQVWSWSYYWNLTYICIICIWILCILWGDEQAHLAGRVFSGSKNLISQSLSLNHQDFSAVWHFNNGLVLFRLEKKVWNILCEYQSSAMDLIFSKNVGNMYRKMNAKNCNPVFSH